MRTSNNRLNQDGHVYDGFDYDLQVWVAGGKVQPCSHPRAMRCGCMADKHKYQHIGRARAEEGLK